MASTAPRRSRSLETRSSLIDAAAHVFVERGFHGATVRQIAERAGFTNPVLYYHFGGKTELYEAVIRTAFARFETLLGAALEPARDPLDCLHAIAAAYLRFGIEEPVLLRILFAELFRPRSGDPDLGFEELRAWIVSRIEGVLRAGVRSGAFAVRDVALARRIFLALLGGLLVEQAREPAIRVLDESLARTAVQTFLHGISSPEAIA
jgi:AcrR family transcriptional regulator